MKKIMVSVLAVAAMLIAASSAMAVSITNGNLVTDEGITYSDSGAEAVTLTDTDGIDDTATAFLFLEIAGYANSNILGIYGFTDSGSSVMLGNTLEVFSGGATPLTSVTLKFDLANGTVTNLATGITASIGKDFGFYITSLDGTFYTHASLNSDQFDHFKLYDTRDNLAGSLLGSDVVLGIEDLWGGGSNPDFNDMVVGVTDVAPVPEPGTILLLGAGLLGIGFFGRRRMKA